MRCLERNKRRMWLSKPTETEVVDEATGLGTGEYVSGWSEPVPVRINAAPQTGDTSGSPFGNESGYALVLVADSNPCGIAEGDVLWLRDGEPSVDDFADAYTVVRVSTSINYVAFGLERRQGR